MSDTKQREKNTIHMTDNLTIWDKKQQATVPGEFKETVQVSEINPYFSSPAAQLFLNFWWVPLQSLFEERFEYKFFPVFACFCEFLHAVESVEAGME